MKQRPTGDELATIIAAVAAQNKDVKPCHDHNYACETCGNVEGTTHPETGMCFVCGADDFIDMSCYQVGIRGEAYIKFLENQK